MQKVKQLTWNNKGNSRSVAIKNSAGQLLNESEEVRERWMEYIEQLYDKDGKPFDLELVWE